VWVGYLEKEFFWGFKTYMKYGPHTTIVQFRESFLTRTKRVKLCSNSR